MAEIVVLYMVAPENVVFDFRILGFWTLYAVIFPLPS